MTSDATPVEAPAATRAPVLLLAAVATIGIQVHGVFSVDLGVSDIFLGAYLIQLAVRRQLPRCPRVLWLTIAAFVAACLIAAARAVSAGGDRATWGSTRLIGVLVVLTYLVVIADASRSQAARRSLLRAMVVGTLAFNVLFVIPWLGHALLTPFPTGGTGRLAGGMFDQNSNATLLAAVTLLALTTRAFGRAVSLALAAGGLALLLLTYSRTGYVAFAAGLLAYLVLEGLARRRRLGGKISGRALAAGAAIVAVALVVLGAVQRQFAGRPDTISTRTEFLRLALDYFSADPLFGAGFGAAQHQVGFVIHSTVFALLGEAGLLGLASFLALVGIVMIRGLRVAWRPSAPVDARGLLAASVCMFVGSFGIDGLLHRHWWVVLGALLGASYAAVTAEGAPDVTRAANE